MQRVALLRRTGTVQSSVFCYGPGSAAHHFVLRSVRGTLNYTTTLSRFAARVMPV
jgi:hypothetical protein